MAVTVLQLWNQACGQLGSQTSIAAEDEVSREAELCSLYYETVRDSIFRAAPWNSVEAHVRLALIIERDHDVDWTSADPAPGWTYAYGVPSDMIRPRYVSDFSKFQLSNIGDTPVILSENSEPILVYTKRQSNPALWGIDLFHAVMYGLAAFVAKPLTGNDSDLRNMFTLAEERILAARANAANQNYFRYESIPDWIGARGQTLGMPTARYIYPSADFTIGGSNPLG
jgi:hypothetical protein